MSKVVEGKLKYSAMLNEDGCLLDDGVVTKLGGERLLPDHLHRPGRADH